MLASFYKESTMYRGYLIVDTKREGEGIGRLEDLGIEDGESIVGKEFTLGRGHLSSLEESERLMMGSIPCSTFTQTTKRVVVV